MHRLPGSVVLSLSVLLLGTAAWADGLPPEAAMCFLKDVGASCTVYGTQEAGECTEDTCTSSRPNIDGGAPFSYACKKCLPGAPSDGSSSDGSSCSIGGQGVAKRIGPWLLAGLFPCVALLVRRMRRRG